MSLSSGEPLLDFIELAAYAVLLAFELIEWHGARVVGLKEFGSFGKQALLSPFECPAFGDGLLPELGELFGQDGFEGVAFVSLQSVERVVRFDLALD